MWAQIAGFVCLQSSRDLSTRVDNMCNLRPIENGIVVYWFIALDPRLVSFAYLRWILKTMK